MSAIAVSPSLIDDTRKDWGTFLSTVEPGQIVVNNLPNRFGKTYSTLEFAASIPGRYLYLSDRHAQMEEVEGWEKAVHWYGLSESCERKDEPFIASLIKRKLGASVICKYFCGRKSCKYKKQFELPNDVIVIAPKEYFPTTYVQDKIWDYVILDEHLEKAQKITCTYPNIPTDVFDSFNINSFFYEVIGSIINGNNEYTTYNISDWEPMALKVAEEDLKYVLKSIKDRKGEFNPTYMEDNLIQYLYKLPETIEWAKNCLMHGPLKHYYKPYLHYAFDLQSNNASRLIILNTSFDREVYNRLSGRYTEKMPEPIHYTKDIINMDSYLLHYNFCNRSFTKKTMTDDGAKFGGRDGEEILDMVKRTINFAYKRNLKIGVITFSTLVDEIHNQFKDKIDVISYFGGHQGSNQLDNVDVLIIVGTYHINPKGLYQKHFIINNEYIADNPATWGGTNNKIINGIQINLSNNEDLNLVKLYRLNEEHQQAIFRSGAHINPGKLVVIFGFVPEGVEKNIIYRKFANKNSLLAHLNILKDKIGS